VAQFSPLSILGEAEENGNAVVQRTINSVPTGERFALAESVGKGNFGLVFAVTLPNGSRMAVKKMAKSKLLTLKAISRLSSEFRMLREPDPARRHPNILYINDVLHSRLHIYIVMPLGGKVSGDGRCGAERVLTAHSPHPYRNFHCHHCRHALTRPDPT